MDTDGIINKNNIIPFFIFVPFPIFKFHQCQKPSNKQTEMVQLRATKLFRFQWNQVLFNPVDQFGPVDIAPSQSEIQIFLFNNIGVNFLTINMLEHFH